MPFALDLMPRLEPVVIEAGKMAQSLRQTLVTSAKPDGSLVTNADKDVEIFLRSSLPDIIDAPIWGEEMGFEESNSEGLWLVDPIDGTSNFVYGQPLWGVTVAYMQNGVIDAGVVCLPDLDWSFAAVRGQGATLNGLRLPTLPTGPIESHELLGQADDDEGPFSHLKGKRRHYGAFVVEAMLMARGGLRAMVCTKAKLYDAAGSIAVLREVGALTIRGNGKAFLEADWVQNVRMEPLLIAAPGVWNS